MTMPSMCKKVVCFDLDDTLYKEIDFLKSGYRKVAELVDKRYHISANEVYYNLLTWYSHGENAFERLNETYGLDNPISDYLNVYRFHQPNILLSDEVRAALIELKRAGILMGIISDGREETQRNKIEALGLSKWICADLIIINEERQYFKPNHWSFDRMMLNCFEKNVDTDTVFYYVGDNTEKDFIAPNELGWVTVCLLDDGRNIHKQSFDIEEVKQPKYEISVIKELIRLL